MSRDKGVDGEFDGVLCHEVLVELAESDCDCLQISVERPDRTLISPTIPIGGSAQTGDLARSALIWSKES